MKPAPGTQRWIPAALFIIAFAALPFTQFPKMAFVPGDIGDARLNNYFLENIYLFVTGHSESLWHLSFFAPFPYILGFSDNLFGASPVYLIARTITHQPEKSFLIWFLFGYMANFASAYYVLRRLHSSTLAASIGAVIFAFALPTSAHAGHAQLHYRFGIPLAVFFASEFLTQKSFRALTLCGAWMVWQFFCGVYIGFFALFLVTTMMMVHVGHNFFVQGQRPKEILQSIIEQWGTQTSQEKVRFALAIAFLLALMAALFYPYLRVSQLYGAQRPWGEIASMLPRLQSYFLSDSSYLWSNTNAKVFADLPARHEHQMFVGIAPLLLALFATLSGTSKEHGYRFFLISGMLALCILLTLNIGGFSLWIFLHKLPLASAIRGMARLDQAILFPVAYLCAIAIDQISRNYKWGMKLICIAILPFTIFELSATTICTTPLDTWRERIASTEKKLPGNLPQNPVVFFAQNDGPPYAEDLDAMWIALNHGIKTFNGYSGIAPPNYSYEYGNDCRELPIRVISYLKFTDKAGDLDAYRTLMARSVPVGFVGCDPQWWRTPPITSSSKVYTVDEVRHLSYAFGRVIRSHDHTYVEVIINNSGDTSFSAHSAIDKPLRVSWRFLNALGEAADNWRSRRDLPLDIPAHGSISMRIPIDSRPSVQGASLQVTMVQEHEFWAHDIGISPISLPWK